MDPKSYENDEPDLILRAVSNLVDATMLAAGVGPPVRSLIESTNQSTPFFIILRSDEENIDNGTVQEYFIKTRGWFMRNCISRGSVRWVSHTDHSDGGRRWKTYHTR